MKTQWEYRIEFVPDQMEALEHLNELGADGWEAVAVWNDQPTETRYLLKRQK
jgi:hypothetical protein